MFGFELWVVLSLSVAHGGQRLIDMVPQVQDKSRGALIVRVLNPNASQAPMVRLSAGGILLQLSCADDGAFPDATPNDSVFHCAALLPEPLMTKGRWQSNISTQGLDGEPVILGEFSFAGGGGFRFATVDLQDPSSSSAVAFSLPSLEGRAGPVHVEVAPDPDDYSEVSPEHVEMPDEHVEVTPEAPEKVEELKGHVVVPPLYSGDEDEEYEEHVTVPSEHVDVAPSEPVGATENETEVSPEHVEMPFKPHVEMHLEEGEHVVVPPLYSGNEDEDEAEVYEEHVRVPAEHIDVAPSEPVAAFDDDFSPVEVEEDAYEDDYTDLPEAEVYEYEADYTEVTPEHEDMPTKAHVEVPLEHVDVAPSEPVAVLEDDFSPMEVEEDAYAYEDDYTEVTPEHEDMPTKAHVDVPLEHVGVIPSEQSVKIEGDLSGVAPENVGAPSKEHVEVVLPDPPKHVEMPPPEHPGGASQGPSGSPEHIEGGPTAHVVVPPPQHDMLPPVHVNEEPDNQMIGQQHGSSGDWSWKWLLGALTLGWAMGQTRKRGPAKMVFRRPKGKEGLVVLPVQAIDGNGPLPSGAPVVIASSDPGAMAAHMMSQITLCRRVVVTGAEDFMGSLHGHPVLSVTDPDRRSIQHTLESLKKDGGVPPVLFILGPDSVIDSSGFSPTPVEDLLHAVGGDVWVALFTVFGSPPIQGIEQWDYDPQAGWSQA